MKHAEMIRFAAQAEDTRAGAERLRLAHNSREYLPQNDENERTFQFFALGSAVFITVALGWSA